MTISIGEESGKQQFFKAGIIGGGKVGRCLAAYLKEQGYLAGITASSREHSAALAAELGVQPMDNVELVKACDVVLLTVPDRLIGTVAASLAEELPAEVQAQEKYFFHCSGSLGLEPLAPLMALGAHCGSLHPLQSFAGGRTALQNVYMAIDGDEACRTVGTKLAKLFGGNAFCVPVAERAAYHAAACICSNYAVTVAALSQRLMSRWTGSVDAAWAALLPLFEGTAANLRRTGDAGSVLTGPISRGDVGTVRSHLAVLPKEMLQVYCSLGLETVRIALANGTIDSETARQLQVLLEGTEG